MVFKVSYWFVIIFLISSYNFLILVLSTSKKNTIKKATITGAKISNHPTPPVITFIRNSAALKSSPNKMSTCLKPG